MDEVGWLVLLICLCVGGSLFFSLHHLALRTFSRVKLFEAFKTSGKEKTAEKLADRAEQLALSCSFFRLICNVGLILLLLYIFQNRTNAYLIVFFIAVVVFELISVALPHSWAKYAGEQILPITYPLLYLAAWLATPVLFILKLHDRLVKRLAGVIEIPDAQAQDQKQEELLSLVEEGHREGAVDSEELEMIESVLELGETTAEEIMTPRTDLVALQADAPLSEILDVIAKEGHSRIPVYGENIDDVIGLVYAKDLLSEIGNGQENFNLRQKIRKAYFVPESKLLKDLLHEFQNQKLHIAVVLDEYGGTAGVVTIEDILEELVGEITDEYESPEPEPLVQIEDNIVEVDARMNVDDLNDKLEIDVPDEDDYETVGGFIFSYLGYIPKTGECFTHNNLKFTITNAEDRRINRLRIEILPPDDENSND